MYRTVLTLLCFASLLGSVGLAERIHDEIDERSDAVEERVISIRHDLHKHPELSNREFRTANVIANYLENLGIDVRTEVAHTGVVGILRGGKKGRVLALRADMDGLPVTEETNLPFKSTERVKFRGRDVGVMHACGHDAHMAILLGTAEVLVALKDEIPGVVMFIFQPAEEGPPAGEEGGAPLMVKEGILRKPRVDAIFGLHVFPYESGTLAVRKQGIMAASDGLRIDVKGEQTHGALPWEGVDPIVVSAQIVLGIQGIVSRQTNLTTAPVVVSIGRIEGGNRDNIVPGRVTMEGTIRTLDPKMRMKIHEDISRTAQKIGEAAGAEAKVAITAQVPVTYNDPDLTEQMIPTLRRVAGEKFVSGMPAVTVAEDFSFFQEQVPGVFFFLGVRPTHIKPEDAAPNHSPRFVVDDTALKTGVRAMANLAVDYLRASRQ